MTNIDPVNRSWLVTKGWYNSPSNRPAADPSFYDLISSEGSFDVYRFQSLLFTAAVGIALLIGGITQLSSFTVPQNILGILGLSQIVYIAGKLVSSNSVSQLNTVVTDLRNAEAKLREAAHAAPADAAAAPVAAPATYQQAIERAGQPAYASYLDKARGAATLFQEVTGLMVDGDKLRPDVGI